MSNIIFNKLMNIRLLHEYYASGISADLKIQTSLQTQSLLSGHGIFFKSTSQGAVLLYELVDDNGTPKVPIEGPLKLTFYLNSNSSFITNFTEAEYSTIPGSVYYFSNDDPGVVADGNDFTIVNDKLNEPIPLITKFLKITKATSASYFTLTATDNKVTQTPFDPEAENFTKDMARFENGKYELKQYSGADIQIGDTTTLYYNSSISGAIPFAVFEVFLDENSIDNVPLNFIFKFKSRETFWRYKVLLKEAAPPPTDDYIIDSTTISITHNPSEGDTILFNAASGADPIVIRSTDKVKLKEIGFEQIGLYRGEENILISSLPNPTPTKLEKVGDDWYSDIYVYVYV